MQIWELEIKLHFYINDLRVKIEKQLCKQRCQVQCALRKQARLQ